ncbi:MAG: bifunctional nuclease family protein [Candidatus Aenigmarchaeota archaeon]|nr:bifunctional nuclease family protein [Candidatus Aenigmarchaeota archaeon]
MSSKKLVVLLLIIGFVVGVWIGVFFSSTPTTKETILQLVEDIIPSTRGLTRITVGLDRTTIMLSGACRTVSFDITNDQAYSITQGLYNQTPVRPLTHDLLHDVFDNFDIRVKQIQIDRYEEEVYKAHLYLERNDSSVELDIRPSDAIALSLRENVPLYMNTTVLETQGTKTC